MAIWADLTGDHWSVPCRPYPWYGSNYDQNYKMLRTMKASHKGARCIWVTAVPTGLSHYSYTHTHYTLNYGLFQGWCTISV